PLPHLAVGVSAAAHWRHLLQALPDAVICFDQAGIVRSLNRAGEHLTGSVEEQVRGRPVWEILADPGCLSPEGINGAWSASDGTVLLGGGAVLRRANGGEVPLDVRVGGFSVGG